MSGRQAAILDQVLLIAHNTGWSEAEILKMPGSRRAHYIRRLLPQERA